MASKRLPLFACCECGHKFYSAAAAERASFGDSGCPGCGGSDIDEYFSSADHSPAWGDDSEGDYGGAFDGFSVVSDADPGL
jgi:hypothetical protein